MWAVPRKCGLPIARLDGQRLVSLLDNVEEVPVRTEIRAELIRRWGNEVASAGNLRPHQVGETRKKLDVVVHEVAMERWLSQRAAHGESEPCPVGLVDHGAMEQLRLEKNGIA